MFLQIWGNSYRLAPKERGMGVILERSTLVAILWNIWLGSSRVHLKHLYIRMVVQFTREQSTWLDVRIWTPFAAIFLKISQGMEDTNASIVLTKKDTELDWNRPKLQLIKSWRQMNRNHSNDCPRHAGEMNLSRRKNLDAVCRDLPNNQSGVGRHKCVYCAYEEGYRAGLKVAIDSINRELEAN